MIALYLHDAKQLAAEDDPVRYFRGRDRTTPDDVAVGFVRILAIRDAKMRNTELKKHCSGCALDIETAGEWRRMSRIPDAFTVVALEMMMEVWGGSDWESTTVWKRLLHHDVGRQLRPLSVVEGPVGELADKLATRVEMAPTNGVPLERRLTT